MKALPRESEMSKTALFFEIYKSLALTVIVLALVGLYLKTPLPFTLQNVRDGVVEIQQIPLVRVQGGHIDAEVSGSVQIER